MLFSYFRKKTIFSLEEAFNLEIKIRNVDPAAVKKIDELAKKKKLSRNQYLKNYVETLSVLEELKKQEERYVELTKLLAGLVERNTTVLSKVDRVLEEIIL